MKKTLITTTLSAALALTACSGIEATDVNITPVETNPSEATQEPVEESGPAVDVNGRGSIALEQGEEGVIMDYQDTILVSFVVSDIETDLQCTADRPLDAENGHFIALDVEIESDQAAAENYVEPDLIFNKAGMRIIGSDGTTRSESPNSGASFECLPESEQLPVTFGPGEKLSGKVVLDVPIESGAILTELGVGEYTQWEWEF